MHIRLGTIPLLFVFVLILYCSEQENTTQPNIDETVYLQFEPDAALVGQRIRFWAEESLSTSSITAKGSIVYFKIDSSDGKQLWVRFPYAAPDTIIGATLRNGKQIYTQKHIRSLEPLINGVPVIDYNLGYPLKKSEAHWGEYPEAKWKKSVHGDTLKLTRYVGYGDDSAYIYSIPFLLQKGQALPYVPFISIKDKPYNFLPNEYESKYQMGLIKIVSFDSSTSIRGRMYYVDKDGYSYSRAFWWDALDSAD